MMSKTYSNFCIPLLETPSEKCINLYPVNIPRYLAAVFSTISSGSFGPGYVCFQSRVKR